MARWLNLAALALLATPAALPAQPDGKPVPAPPAPPSAQEIAINDALVCKRAPLSFEYTQRWLLDNEWTPTTPNLPDKRIVTDGEARFAHGEVTVSIVPHLEQRRLSRCTSVATIPGTPAWSELQPALTAVVGREPESAAADGAVWAVPDHRIEARLEGNRLTVTMTPTGYNPFAISPATIRALETPTTPAPAADIAAAAVACVAAAGAGRPIPVALVEAGWTMAADRPGRFTHEGSNASILSFGSQCVVDAYGERPDAYDEIRDAIRAALVARFGRDVRLPASTGHAGDFSRGQGFVIGSRMGILSSEARTNGLSIRFTVMSF